MTLRAYFTPKRNHAILVISVLNKEFYCISVRGDMSFVLHLSNEDGCLTGIVSEVYHKSLGSGSLSKLGLAIMLICRFKKKKLIAVKAGGFSTVVTLGRGTNARVY